MTVTTPEVPAGAPSTLRPLNLMNSTILVAIALSPAWWLLGVDFIIYFLLAVPAYLASVGRQKHSTLQEMTIFLLVILLFFSALVGTLFLDVEMSRLFAAAYNIAVLLSGVFVVKAIRHKMAEGDAFFLKLGQLAFPVLVVFSAISFAGAAIAYFRGIFLEFPTFLGIIFPGELPGLIATSQTASIARPDWLVDMMVPRTIVMSPYPNASAVTALLLGAWAWLKTAWEPKSSSRTFKRLLIYGMLGGVLILTGSRAVIIGVVLGVVVLQFLYGGWTRRFLAIGLLMMVLAGGQAIDTASYMVDIRGGSSTTRFDNYHSAWDLVVKVNPLLGLGVKPRDDIETIALGSHSTIVSIFTKGGLLGVFAVVASLFLIPTLNLFKLLRSRVPDDDPLRKQALVTAMLISHLAVLSWMLFEDIDAPALASFMIFCHFGLLQVFTLKRTNPDLLELRTSRYDSTMIGPAV